MKLPHLFTIISILLTMHYTASMAQSKPGRKDLLHVLLNDQRLSQIEVKEVTMAAGQSAPKHNHPCPVAGYITSGRVLFQIEGEEKQILNKGEAFYEPRDKVILHFDNDSTEEPLTFVAFYLKEASEEIVRILE